MKIYGTGSALPALTVDNHMLAKFMDTSDEWIRLRTGIHTRHLLSGETLTDLAAQASFAAMENAGIGAESIDFIICATIQGDTITPGLGCALQGAIGARCPTVDLNAACAGFLYALDMADAYIRSGKAKTILIACADAPSRFVDWRDRATCILFGDGAAAAVVGEGEGLLATRLTNDCHVEKLYARTERGNSPYLEGEALPTTLVMTGQEVYKFAISHAYQDIQWIAEHTGIGVEQFDHFFIHQANLRIVEALRIRLDLPVDRFHSCITRTGNTSSVTVPFMLDEANRAGALKPGDLLLMSAFGAGMTTGACVIKW